MPDIPTTANFDPVAISPAHGDWLAKALNAVNDPTFAAAIEKMESGEASDQLSEDGYWPEEGSWMCRYRPYAVKDGVLHIPISGGLTPNFPYTITGWVTGYEYITRAVQRGAQDDTVKGIALVVDSGGGYVQGCFECADHIYEARMAKPIHAFAKDHAYSAAYALASSAHHVTTPQTGGVGSVGVIATHFDLSDMMKGHGVTVTLVRSGKKKASGHPYERLGKKEKARIQQRVDHSNDIFAALVSRNRGMDADEIKGLEGEAFMSHEAVANGLADEIGSFDDAVAAYAASLTNQGGDTMSDKDTTAVDKAVHDQAVSDAKADGMKEGKALGATEERSRISAIMSSEEAKERPIAAQNVAMNTGQTVEEAATFLAAMPVEAPKADDSKADDKATGKDPFTEKMDNDKQPDLGAGTGGDDDQDDEAAALAQIMGDHASITGKVTKAA